MLSTREIQVSELIAWGASDKEVAQELDISPETAKVHRRHILKKIEGHNATDICRYYFRSKLRVSFGINPRHVRHLATILLFLVINAEFSQIEMIRPRISRRVRLERRREE